MASPSIPPSGVEVDAHLPIAAVAVAVASWLLVVDCWLVGCLVGWLLFVGVLLLLGGLLSLGMWVGL